MKPQTTFATLAICLCAISAAVGQTSDTQNFLASYRNSETPPFFGVTAALQSSMRNNISSNPAMPTFEKKAGMQMDRKPSLDAAKDLHRSGVKVKEPAKSTRKAASGA